MDTETENDGSVHVTVELTGKYEKIARIIGEDESKTDEMGFISDDLTAIIEVVTRTGGATKSQIAESVSGDLTSDLDAETVIYMLRVLELYDLVVLDGNTWRPGPALS